MLTDIFANRYRERRIWTALGAREATLLTQCFRVLAEQLIPCRHDNNELPDHVAIWAAVERNLSMELGVEELSPKTWNFIDVAGKHQWGTYTLDFVCRAFMRVSAGNVVDADLYMKARMSFVELAFREKAGHLRRLRGAAQLRIATNALRVRQLHARSLRSVPALPQDQGYAAEQLGPCDAADSQLEAYAAEVNERLRQAGVPLNLHNGLIQVTSDELVEAQVGTPFWAITADPRWLNVDIDMKEAVDRREAGERDPAFYAAKALESAIKIISDMRGWTRGTERGASQYIDNLQSSANGAFIATWEATAIRHIFTEVRNELGHGPGGKPMPELTQQQTDWVIEAGMSWVKSLVRRL